MHICTYAYMYRSFTPHKSDKGQIHCVAIAAGSNGQPDMLLTGTYQSSTVKLPIWLIIPNPKRILYIFPVIVSRHSSTLFFLFPQLEFFLLLSYLLDYLITNIIKYS